MDKSNKNPAIRFKGFTEDWKNQELGESLTERKEMQKISENAPILAFASGQGVIDRSERKSNNRDHLTLDQENKIYKLTEFNDIVYNPSNLKYGAIDRNKHGRGVISPIYVTFTTEEEPSFMELIVKSEKFKLKALQYEEGTVVKRQSVSPENLLSIEVKLSKSLNEQRKIGVFFERLDDLRIFHEHKYEKLRIIKKVMLEKMFPKNGADVPEIRFKGFSKAWKVSTFNEAFDCSIPTNTLSRANLSNTKGEIKNVHYGDILVKYTAITDVTNTNIPFIAEGKISTYTNQLLKNGDIVIADAAEDITVGKAIEISNIGKELIVAGLHTIVCRPKIKIKPFYLGHYINSNSYRQPLVPLFQGTKVLSISKSNLAKTYIKYPDSEDEQYKIGTYFNNLDKLINIHHCQLEKIKNIKKACFSKMFVAQD
ncbi:restriction endonuclease subunit S [Flavobacterium sp. GN10]|uniref:Restriction endonuclease subunit S n=1 Tax=Flavobacterium tagetis TaxID=2801336 RepID=A0ABS1KEN3_9FLAO|nr:restriction endonuclease subunit S [Flavobacterium tagetis]MBL0737810.1 restriction endonuclease subunit S [Flavobacterium tagetis]